MISIFTTLKFEKPIDFTFSSKNTPRGLFFHKNRYYLIFIFICRWSQGFYPWINSIYFKIPLIKHTIWFLEIFSKWYYFTCNPFDLIRFQSIKSPLPRPDVPPLRGNSFPLQLPRPDLGLRPRPRWGLCPQTPAGGMLPPDPLPGGGSSLFGWAKKISFPPAAGKSF